MATATTGIKPNFDLVAFVLLATPWLQTISFGPTTSVLQLAITYSCASLLWLLCCILSLPIRARQVKISWLGAACISAVIGLMQFFAVVGPFEVFVVAAEQGQAYANLRQRNQFATLLNIGLVVAYWGNLSLRPTNVGGGLHKTSEVWQVLAVICLASAIAASGSRTGLAQIIFTSALIFLWASHLRRPIYALVSYCLAASIFPLLEGNHLNAGGILARLGEVVPSCNSRLTLWSNVLDLIVQKPWFGWGWGELDYAHFITLYPGERFCEILDNAHNLPLHLAVELGVPVAAAFCGLCTWLVWHNKPWAETDPTRQLAWGVLAVIGLHSMLEYPLWYGPFQLAVVLCIWLLWRGTDADADSAQVHQSQSSVLARSASSAAALTLLACCAYAAWDYWRISQIYLPPSARQAAYKEDTLAKIQGSWLFRDQVQFAELTTTPLNANHAAHINKLAKAMLHFSPEPRVVEKVIESAVLLNQDDEALFYLQRYKTAFPAQHARWSAALKVPKQD